MKHRNIEEEIVILRDLISNSEQIPLKLKQAIIKQIGVVKKCTKQITSKKTQNQNSGLLKLYNVTKEIADFSGWDPDEKHSRIDVTKSICNYIKTNNLANPDNRKNIFPDAQLSNILRWNDDNEQITIEYTHVDSNVYAFNIVTNNEKNIHKNSYYNNAILKNDEKFNKDSVNIGIVKNFKQENEKCFIQFYTKVNIKENCMYRLCVPLTYPCIQTKIGIHFLK
jgi:hypothetical protein